MFHGLEKAAYFGTSNYVRQFIKIYKSQEESRADNSWGEQQITDSSDFKSLRSEYLDKLHIWLISWRQSKVQNPI